MPALQAPSLPLIRQVDDRRIPTQDLRVSRKLNKDFLRNLLGCCNGGVEVLFSGLVVFGNITSVNSLGSADQDLTDLALFGEFPQRLSCKTSIDLQLLYHCRDGDELHLGNLRMETFVLFLCHQHLVIDLVTGLSLGPLLLLSLTTRHGGGHFLLFRLLLNFWRHGDLFNAFPVNEKRAADDVNPQTLNRPVRAEVARQAWR
mmetsp:Transcript_7112/g.16261  ORF Transcript_7112/g.16261 Transcript_7112/m.16261 type:complete len:202 (-) Transcript_7112:41-646(-)